MGVQQFLGRVRVACSSLIVLLGSVPPLDAAIITVTSGCTLVDAITAANSDTATGGCPAGSGADEIWLTGDVTLTAVDNYEHEASGLPTVNSEIVLEGNGFTIRRSAEDETPEFRILHVASEGSLTLNQVTLVNAYLLGEGWTNLEAEGGAIRNFGTVSLLDSALLDNFARRGGGICNRLGGTVTLMASTVSGNRSGGPGGGIHNADAGSTVTITDSKVSENSTNGCGGGVYNLDGEVILTNSRVSGNRSSDGGGICTEGGNAEVTGTTVSENSVQNFGGGVLAAGALTISNSTISGNEAWWEGGGGILVLGVTTVANTTISDNKVNSNWGYGGGLLTLGGSVQITNSTFSGNGASNAGGIWGAAGPVTLTNTILANSPEGGNCLTGIIDAGNNLSDDTTCSTIPGNLTGLEAQLLDNGGPTMTHALLEGSNAIDAGSALDCPATDQRGAPRVSTCDIGAFEFIPCPDLVLSVEVVTGTETRQNCQAIIVGPHFSVANTGKLTLRAGKQIAIGDDTSVEDGGELTLEIEPDLQMVPP